MRDRPPDDVGVGSGQAGVRSLAEQAAHRVLRRSEHQQDLAPRRLATFQRHRSLWHAQPLGNKLKQGSVRPAFARWRRDTNLQRVAMQAKHFASPRCGLNMDGQRDRAIRFAQPVEHGSDEHQNQLREDDGNQRRQVDGTDQRHDPLDRAQDRPGQL